MILGFYGKNYLNCIAGLTWAAHSKKMHQQKIEKIFHSSFNYLKKKRTKNDESIAFYNGPLKIANTREW